MDSPQKPLVYLILGASGSGRREVVADLIDGGLAETDRVAVLLAEGEPTDPADAKLPEPTRWSWSDEAQTISGEIPAGTSHVFFFADGRRNPVDQLEVFKPWVEAQGAEIARVLCVVNCQLAEKNPSLLAWYEACVHFSDVVLLNRREGVGNKWISDFQGHFKDRFVPSLFEFVKGGRVRNPALILQPEARRMSHALDEEQNWVITDEDGETMDADEFDEDEELEGGPSREEEIEVKPEEEPYFTRDAAGRRQKRIPDIAKFLDAGTGDAPRDPTAS